jgi:hypothetical protein
MITDQAAIVVGLGQTDFAKLLPQTELGMAIEAIRPSEVDGTASFNLEPNIQTEIARTWASVP